MVKSTDQLPIASNSTCGVHFQSITGCLRLGGSTPCHIRLLRLELERSRYRSGGFRFDGGRVAENWRVSRDGTEIYTTHPLHTSQTSPHLSPTPSSLTASHPCPQPLQQSRKPFCNKQTHTHCCKKLGAGIQRHTLKFNAAIYIRLRYI